MNARLFVVLALVVILAVGGLLLSLNKDSSAPVAQVDEFEGLPPDGVVCLAALKLTQPWPKGWPELPFGSEEAIRKMVKEDPTRALDELKRLVYDQVSLEMVRAGQHPKTARRLGWDNNNASTSLLFLEYPYAKRMGLVDDLLKDLKEIGRWTYGRRVEGEEWQKLVDWRHSGKWPIEGEAAPVYIPDV